MSSAVSQAITLAALAFTPLKVCGNGPGPWKPLTRSMGRPEGETNAMVGRDWTLYFVAISVERWPASVSILTATNSVVMSLTTSGST